MKKLFLGLCLVLVSFGMMLNEAEAARLGGGRSMGMQRQSLPSRPMAAPSAPAAAPVGAAVAQPNRWAGPLMGLAAGLGIGALMSHLGMGGAFGNIILMALLAFAAFAAFQWFMRRNAGNATQSQQNSPFNLAGASAGANTANTNTNTAHNIDIGSNLGGSAATGAAKPLEPARIPAGFDVEGFARTAKVNFLRMQASNDSGNLDDLREFTSPEMFAEIKLDIADRKGAKQQTEVSNLEAEVLEVVNENNNYVASVAFRGIISESIGTPAQPFAEIWNLSKPVDGSHGWVVAGIQQIN
jgi:predicted lipid-binding transport protein (Tim44 family)